MLGVEGDLNLTLFPEWLLVGGYALFVIEVVCVPGTPMKTLINSAWAAAVSEPEGERIEGQEWSRVVVAGTVAGGAALILGGLTENLSFDLLDWIGLHAGAVERGIGMVNEAMPESLRDRAPELFVPEKSSHDAQRNWYTVAHAAVLGGDGDITRSLSQLRVMRGAATWTAVGAIGALCRAVASSEDEVLRRKWAVVVPCLLALAGLLGWGWYLAEANYHRAHYVDALVIEMKLGQTPRPEDGTVH